TFEAIDWNTALDEIAAKMLVIRDRYGPRSFGHYGGGGQGNHSGGGYGIMMMRGFGSTEFYSSVAQEKSGRYWVNGRMFGSQNANHSPLIEDTELLVVWGSHMWQANCEPGARTHLREAAKEEGRKIIVVDPVRTKDAEFADLHLQIKPGTDTYLLGAMLKLLHDKAGFDQDFIDEHTEGWQNVESEIAKIPADEWIAHTGLARADIEQAVAMIIDAESMALRTELGIEMGRHSTLNSYLGNLLFLGTGNFGRPGTHAIHTWLVPLIGNSKGKRSLVNEQEEIMGVYPPNRFASEVLSDKPDRLRGMLIDSSNPANTAANTEATEAALKALELLVVVDVQMSETAMLADYILPASSQYEKWEFTYFNMGFPKNYFHLRPPLFDALEGTRIEGEIYSQLARRLGLMPEEHELTELRELAGRDRASFAESFQNTLRSQKGMATVAPLVLYETLGKSLENGAASAAILWPACHQTVKRNQRAVQRALESENSGPALGEELFETILNSPSGTPFSENDFEDIWGFLSYPDKKIRMHIPEMIEWMNELNPALEPDDKEYPFVISLGQRRQYNANQIIRTPAWRGKDVDGNLRLHPEELERLGIDDGGWITVETKTGVLTARAEADETLRLGYATLPHGYGMKYKMADGEEIAVGPRLNMLSDSNECDPIGATPYHKNVAAKLRAASEDEAGMSEAIALKVQTYIEQYA
ncbi:MAG: molybdopterin-dependent oxidoreductase, partial [Pseudomonadota bacterium]